MFDGLIVGVVSGIVASACFSLFLLLVRPKILLSDQICKSSSEPGVYRIKIINKSKAELNNVYYNLLYCRDEGDDIKVVDEIPPRKSRLYFIDKYHYFKKDEDYALRISYDIDEQKYPLNEKSYFEFNIIANHSLSNTMKCVKKVYTQKDVLEGLFETGKSMKILRKNTIPVQTGTGISS
ncbi:MAG: hypothetical protein IKL80_01220 [Clostridia bacterium]|nr:hypothetical protein [Clostridia bacterium]